MKKILIIMFALIFLVSCKTTQQTTENIVYRDRVVYQDKVVHDSIYQKEYEKQYIKGDTVFVDRLQYKFISKEVHDTLLVQKSDTIVNIQEKVVVEYKQNWFQRLFFHFGIVIMLSLIGYLGYLLLKKRNFLH